MRAQSVNNKIKVTPEYMEYVENDKPEGTLGNDFEAFDKWVRHWGFPKQEMLEKIRNGLEGTYEDYVGYSEMLENKEYADEEEKEMLEERVEGAKYMNTVWQIYSKHCKLYYK
jgi:hypothetical protein